jgi:tRNA/rRNA methyltransferase/tRNA (cytidine32/uridine32-2'-O)-methyltransferase
LAAFAARTPGIAPASTIFRPVTGSALDRVTVVLYEPQDPVNIGATVRAMKNMGVSELRLVRPCEYTTHRISGIAHGTADVIERIRHFDTLDEALADCVAVAGFTARRRAAKRPVVDARAAAPELIDRAGEGTVALLFGREDSGLPNDALDRAHVVVTLSTTTHSSLNLAQAVLLALYELHLSAGDVTRRLGRPKRDAPPATAADYELTFPDVERALEAIQFFKTRHHERIMRTVRSLLFRASPDTRELALVRAMAIEVLRTIDRIKRGLEC